MFSHVSPCVPMVSHVFSCFLMFSLGSRGARAEAKVCAARHRAVPRRTATRQRRAECNERHVLTRFDAFGWSDNTKEKHVGHCV